MSDDLCAHIADLLEPLGVIRTRKMFGAHGVYCDDLMFAIVDDGALWFKVDAGTKPRYDDAGLAQFSYPKKDGSIAYMSYCQAPDDAYDDQDVMLDWAREALDVATRKKAASPKPRPRRPK